MDWKLLLIGTAMTVLGGFLMFRFRRSNFRKETGPGCIMAFAMLLVLTGVLTVGISFMMRF